MPIDVRDGATVRRCDRGGVLYESQLIRRRAPCFDPLGQSMLHPDASGMKHGTRDTHENHLGFVLGV